MAILSFPVREVGHQGFTGNCPRVFLILFAGGQSLEMSNKSNSVREEAADAGGFQYCFLRAFLPVGWAAALLLKKLGRQNPPPPPRAVS